MAELEFKNVWKQFEDGTIAVQDLNLKIEDHEFVVFVGPSGCGKSTSLRMVAGLEDVSAGDLMIDGRVVNNFTPKARDVAMVFQNYALYPHMNVSDNMGFSLKLAKVDKAEVKERVGGAASVLGLRELLHRRPREMSGGQRQRVAMGRAIVRSPKVFLMDEPLSNLDAKLRVQMRAEISRLQEELGTTTLYVTHDQIEAMTMGDRVAVMRLGDLQQYDTPQALYRSPANVFVAGFIGSPPMNLCEAQIDRRESDYIVRFGTNELTVPPAALAKYPKVPEYVGQQIALGLRPESFFIPDAATPEVAKIRARVNLVELLGADALVHLTTDATPIMTDEIADSFDDKETFEAFREQQKGGFSMVARIDPRTAPTRNDDVAIGFDTDELHFFDAVSGLALR